MSDRSRIEPNPQAEELDVVVADDDPFARRAISDALSRDGIVVGAEARDGLEAMRLCLEHRPDVLVMDVMMPGIDGITATRRIREQIPDQVIVLLTSSNDDELGIIGLRAGAAGFLPKELGLDTLARAMRGAHAGEAVLSRRFGMRLVEHLRSAPEPAGSRSAKGPLTPREWEVMGLLMERRTTEQMAHKLGLSPETVRSHVKHILRKLEARSRAEAVEVAQRLRGVDGLKPAG